MRIEYFQYIIEVAESKSISKAAKKLYLTQPSLSIAIQNCEEEMGFRIFERSNHGVVLTDKGRALCEIARQINLQLGQIRTLSEKKEQEQSTVCMAAVPAFCNAMMIDLINQMKRETPEVRVDIQEYRPFGIIPALAGGEAALGIGNYSERTRKEIYDMAARHKMVVEPIFEDYMGVFLPGDHPLAASPYLTLDELEGEMPIYFNDYMLIDNFEQTMGELTLPAAFYSFSDRADIKKAISKGLGYAILPYQMAADDIYCESGAIRVVRLAERGAKLTTFAVHPTGAVLGKSEKKVLTAVRSLYGALERRRKIPQIPLEEQGVNGAIFY